MDARFPADAVPAEQVFCAMVKPIDTPRLRCGNGYFSRLLGVLPNTSVEKERLNISLTKRVGISGRAGSGLAARVVRLPRAQRFGNEVSFISAKCKAVRVWIGSYHKLPD